MNLGQLFDPEWVQSGCPERFAPVRQVSVAKLEVRTHTVDKLAAGYHPAAPAPRVDEGSPERRLSRRLGRPRASRGAARAILEQLERALTPLTLAMLAPRLGSEAPKGGVGALGAYLARFMQRGLVARSHVKPYAYRITPLGRERLR